ncbi:MAG: glycosyltransferase [Promethearchaeota archaeon]
MSDIPNNRYWFHENETGLLFDSIKIEELTNIIRKILEGKISMKARQQMAIAAYNLVNTKADPETFRKKLLSLLKSV